MNEIEQYIETEKLAKKFADAMMNGHDMGDDEMIREFLSDKERFEQFRNKLEHAKETQKRFEKILAEDKSQKVNDLLNKINRYERIKKVRLIALVSSIAAAVLFVSFLIWNHDGAETVKVIAQNEKIDVPTLILSDGQKIKLDDTKKVSENMNPIKDSVVREIQYNTLVVPKQHTFKIELGDGTTVTLNANSELRYPTVFRGGSREVFLKGEAYFDVRKEDSPFVVKVEECMVKVYGTQFNINSYDTGSIQTVLVKGSVGVTVDGRETMIKPNEMANVDKDGICKVEVVEVNKCLAWLGNEIKSFDEPLDKLFEKISNWYGVQFVYGDEINKIKITTSLSCDLELKEILSGITKITGVKIIKTEDEKYMIK